MTASHNLGLDELLALLRDPSLRPDSIAEEMECAGCARPQPAEVERARAVLARFAAGGAEAVAGEGALTAREAEALPPLLGLAVVHAAGASGLQDVLRELATGRDKALAKEAKRELQRLKQKGVQVQELRPRGEPTLRPPAEAEAPPSYVSSIDPFGERAVWWTRAAKAGVEVVQVVLSDVKGILAVDALGLSRRSFRDFVKRLPRGGGVVVAEVHRDHARRLIAEAEAAGARNGFSPPSTYAEALRLLGPTPAPGAPAPWHDLVESPGDGGAGLFDDPLFQAWIPEEDAFRSFALRADEIATSQLYVDASQRLAALDDAAASAAESYFTPARKARYARRLSEMAHMLRAEGRLEGAGVALSAARALERGESPSFCRTLFTHSLLERLGAARPAPQPPPGLLVP